MSVVSRLTAIEKILKDEWTGARCINGGILTTYRNFVHRWGNNTDPSLPDSLIIYLENVESTVFDRRHRIVRNHLNKYWTQIDYLDKDLRINDADPKVEPFLFALSQVAEGRWAAAKAKEIECCDVLVRYDTFCKAMSLKPLSDVPGDRVIMMSHDKDLRPSFLFVVEGRTIATEWMEYSLPAHFDLNPQDCLMALLQNPDRKFQCQINSTIYDIDQDFLMNQGITPEMFKVKWRVS